MSVRAVMLLAAVLTHQLHAQDTKKSEDSKLLHNVVALITDVYYCYGTLISPNWVVTAATCFDATFVQYGNLSIPFNETTSMRKILFSKQPRSTLAPDLGLVYIKSVHKSYFGQLSAVDYKAMLGHGIKYTNFLIPQEEILKEGLVISCNVEKKFVLASHLCVAPLCLDKHQLSLQGEPGSPLFFDGKLAGVHIGDGTFQSFGDTKLYFLRTYTPISPYLSWINEVITTKELETSTTSSSKTRAW